MSFFCHLAPHVFDGILKGYKRVAYFVNTRQKIPLPSTGFVMLRFNFTKLAAHKLCTNSITFQQSEILSIDDRTKGI